jgi:hypothetical protein
MGNVPANQAARLGYAGLAAIVMIPLALLAGCGSGSAAQPAADASRSPNAMASNNGTGPVVSAGQGNGSQGNQMTSSWTVAFAKCMRAHGVPNFPDPNSQGGQLGPGSGIDPSSPKFKTAVDGPCLSLAPAGWVSSGKVTK